MGKQTYILRIYKAPNILADFCCALSYTARKLNIEFCSMNSLNYVHFQIILICRNIFFSNFLCNAISSFYINIFCKKITAFKLLSASYRFSNSAQPHKYAHKYKYSL
jgi:hypothetical protein